jgi:hypothetical protein
MDSISVSDSLSSFVWGVGNCDGDPLFVDSLGADFHLSTGSHCIAAGVDSIEVDGVWERAPLSDIEGLPRPRPLGTHPDMGAYEEQLANPVSVERQSAGNAPIAFGLAQNYPNPFSATGGSLPAGRQAPSGGNPTTTIEYTIGGVVALSGAHVSGVEGPAANNVRLAVYDLLGREVAMLVNEKKAPGKYVARFDASGLSSGVYFYRLTAGSFSQTRSMLLVK